MNDTLRVIENYVTEIVPYGSGKNVLEENFAEFICKELESLLIKNNIKHKNLFPVHDVKMKFLFEIACYTLLRLKLSKILQT